MEWVSKLYITFIFIQKPTLGTVIHKYNNRPGCFVTHSLYNLSYEVRLSTEIVSYRNSFRPDDGDANSWLLQHYDCAQKWLNEILC